MLGGNEIANGMSPEKLADRVNKVTNKMLQGNLTASSSHFYGPGNRLYNNPIKSYADLTDERYFMDLVITFWRWAVRQTCSTNDGVHL